MKRFIFLLFLIVIISCESNNEEERFYRTYRQILIARSETEDSILANTKVMKILQKNGYSEQQFRQTYFTLAQKQKDFIRIIDSLRYSIKNEYKQIIDSTKVKDKRIEE